MSIRSLNQSPTLATPETDREIKFTKRYKRLKYMYIYIYSKKRFASLLKTYSIFRNSSIVKRKPKFLWMGLVIFFVEWTLLKVQFGLFNHIGIQHWFSLREGAFFPGGGGEWGLRGEGHQWKLAPKGKRGGSYSYLWWINGCEYMKVIYLNCG